MAVLPILRWPDPRLSQPCGPVEGNAAALVADMFETMYAATGRGLAAPQVGVMDTTWKEGDRNPRAFLDPQIVARSRETAVADEGCLSIPGVLVSVTRAAEVTLAWTDADGATWEETFHGAAATCVQHEMDHLDGVVTFDRLDAEARRRAEQSYADVGA